MSLLYGAGSCCDRINGFCCKFVYQLSSVNGVVCLVGTVSKGLCRVPFDVVFGLSVMFINVVCFVSVFRRFSSIRLMFKFLLVSPI